MKAGAELQAMAHFLNNFLKQTGTVYLMFNYTSNSSH